MPTSNASPTFYREAFMVLGLDSDGIATFDPLSPALHDYINSLTQFEDFQYVQGQRLQTIAFHKHGTTSTWWIILMVNGLIREQELQPGMHLSIPLLADLRANVNLLTAPIARSVTF